MSAFVGPVDPTGNLWFPPDLMVMGIPAALARQMAADVDASFIGKRSRIAFPEHRIPVKPPAADKKNTINGRREPSAETLGFSSVNKG